MTSDQMPVIRFKQRWQNSFTIVKFFGMAARRKGASSLRKRMGQVAVDDDFFPLQIWIRLGNGGDKRLRIGMLRLFKNDLGFRHLYDLAEIETAPLRRTYNARHPDHAR